MIANLIDKLKDHFVNLSYFFNEITKKEGNPEFFDVLKKKMLKDQTYQTP